MKSGPHILMKTLNIFAPTRSLELYLADQSAELSFESFSSQEGDPREKKLKTLRRKNTFSKLMNMMAN